METKVASGDAASGDRKCDLRVEITALAVVGKLTFIALATAALDPQAPAYYVAALVCAIIASEVYKSLLLWNIVTLIYLASLMDLKARVLKESSGPMLYLIWGGICFAIVINIAEFCEGRKEPKVHKIAVNGFKIELLLSR